MIIREATDRWLTFAEVEAFFGTNANGEPRVKEKWVRENWRKRGMPGKRIGSNVLFNEEALKDWATEG